MPTQTGRCHRRLGPAADRPPSSKRNNSSHRPSSRRLSNPRETPRTSSSQCHSLRRNRKPRPGTTGNSRRLSHSPSSSRFPNSLSSSPAEAEVVSPVLAVVPPTAITITTITTTIRAAASVNRSTRWIRSRAPTRTRNRKSRTIGRGTTARCWPATRRSHCPADWECWPSRTRTTNRRRRLRPGAAYFRLRVAVVVVVVAAPRTDPCHPRPTTMTPRATGR
uniref:(northern house mosquito) hypothetical protein n=1 Tax=Culex pipiens TaxID=7175 RepID=A0A8D8CHU7_CULPI